MICTTPDPAVPSTCPSSHSMTTVNALLAMMFAVVMLFHCSVLFVSYENALLQTIILRRTAAGLLHGIFRFVLVHLAVDDFILVKPEFVEHVPAIYEYIRQFFTYVGDPLLTPVYGTRLLIDDKPRSFFTNFSGCLKTALLQNLLRSHIFRICFRLYSKHLRISKCPL